MKRLSILLVAALMVLSFSAAGFAHGMAGRDVSGNQANPSGKAPESFAMARGIGGTPETFADNIPNRYLPAYASSRTTNENYGQIYGANVPNPFEYPYTYAPSGMARG